MEDRALMKAVCKHCGSDEVLAVAKWDVAVQSWVYTDCDAFCEECDHKCTLKWVRIYSLEDALTSRGNHKRQ